MPSLIKIKNGCGSFAPETKGGLSRKGGYLCQVL